MIQCRDAQEVGITQYYHQHGCHVVSMFQTTVTDRGTWLFLPQYFMLRTMFLRLVVQGSCPFCVRCDTCTKRQLRGCIQKFPDWVD